MIPCNQIPQNQRWKSAAFGMRQGLFLLLSLAVFVGQTNPAMASHEAGSSAVWIEICTDGGSKFIEFDISGQREEPECTHCVFCLVPLGETQAAEFTATGKVELSEFTLTSYPSDQVLLPDNPEKYWSVCRGPPAVSTGKMMTTLTHLSGYKPADVALNTWSNL